LILKMELLHADEHLNGPDQGQKFEEIGGSKVFLVEDYEKAIKGILEQLESLEEELGIPLFVILCKTKFEALELLSQIPNPQEFIDLYLLDGQIPKGQETKKEAEQESVPKKKKYIFQIPGEFFFGKFETPEPETFFKKEDYVNPWNGIRVIEEVVEKYDVNVKKILCTSTDPMVQETAETLKITTLDSKPYPATSGGYFKTEAGNILQKNFTN